MANEPPVFIPPTLGRVTPYRHAVAIAACFQPMKNQLLRAFVFLNFALLFGQAAHAQTILGTAGAYAVMAGSTVTNNGITTITGDLGAANYAGSGSYNLTGAQVSPATPQNLADLSKAYNGLAAMTPTTNLTGLILGTTPGAITLTPGIYNFSSTAQLTGNLVLDAQNQSNAVWVFQIGSTLTTAVGSSVTFANLAANSVANDGVFWQVGTATVFGVGTSFEGNLLGGSTFDLGSGATINDGRVLAGVTGTITLASDGINFDAANSGYSGGLMFDGGGNVVASTAIPEPAAFLWLAPLGVMGFALRRRSARVRSC
jgi:type VI secretion system secreted protein VgrG